MTGWVAAGWATVPVLTCVGCVVVAAAAFAIIVVIVVVAAPLLCTIRLVC